MALVGISKTDTFEHVSDSDPCKRRVKELARAEPDNPDSPMLETGNVVTVIDDGATRFKLGVLDVFLMGMIYDRSTTMRRTVDDTGEVSLSTAVNATNIESVRYGLHGCPRRPIKDDPQYWNKLLFHYQLFRDGHRTDEGSIQDQSFKAMTLFGAIQDIAREVEAQLEEDEKVRAAMRAGRG